MFTPLCFSFLAIVSRFVSRLHGFVIQTICFWNFLCWRIGWKNILIKCQWRVPGARMPFKRQMHGSKRGLDNGVSPEIWSGGFQFHMITSGTRLIHVWFSFADLHSFFFMNFKISHPSSKISIGRFSMCGLMRLLDMFQLLNATLRIGRNGGRIQRMWSCISLWAKIMCHSTR